MKYTYLIFSSLLTLTFIQFSCSTEEKVKEKEGKTIEKEELPLVEIKNGVYTEYYPGRKAIKIRGQVDNNKLREGKWILYSETGMELSISHYSHGTKDGHSIVKYPNGALYYFGEYRKDKKVGVWTTYDENGKVKTEQDFGGL